MIEKIETNEMGRDSGQFEKDRKRQREAEKGYRAIEIRPDV